MKKTLIDLQGRAQLALKQKELTEIAQRFTPTEAYTRAITSHYNEELARSCRFLAIIRRDYGIDGFKKSLRLAEVTDADNRLKNEIAKGIEFLEVIGGGRLMIVYPEDRGLSLVEYLTQSRADSIDLGLSLGEYKISLKCQLRPHNMGGFEMYQSLKVAGPNGVIEATTGADKNHLVEEQVSSIYYGDGQSKPSSEELRNRLYDQLKSNLLSHWSQESVADLIIKDLKKQGHTVVPSLWEACKEKGVELWELKEYGLIDKLQQIANETREKAVRDGVSPQALGYLDFKIHQAMTEAVLKDARYNKNISLLDKLRQPKDRLKFCVDHYVIPGVKASRTYNFLIHAQYGVDQKFIDILGEKGYGGSVVVSFSNIPSGMAIAQIGQCDAFLQDYNGGSETKLRILNDAQETMEKAQCARGNKDVPKVQVYRLGRHTAGLGKFLDEHFPL